MTKPHRTPAERAALRQRYINEAIAKAKLTELTIRCRDAELRGRESDHRLCRGESRDGAGCLCRCHDAALGIDTS
jgi:hypothetical protein